METSIEGGCLCGGLRYRLRQNPEGVENCHCIDCRRASGAPFVTWGSVRAELMELLRGKLRVIRHADRLRSFAACCGTPLFFQREEGAEWMDVTIASLDDPAPFAPETAIWTEDTLSWIRLDPSMPAHRQKRP